MEKLHQSWHTILAFESNSSEDDVDHNILYICFEVWYIKNQVAIYVQLYI